MRKWEMQSGVGVTESLLAEFPVVHKFELMKLWLKSFESFSYLIHWGLVTPFGDKDLGQHWFR